MSEVESKVLGPIAWGPIFPSASCVGRVSSKQANKNFGASRNKPKGDLFWLCFGLFRETKN
jgi:hypothetical protein